MKFTVTWQINTILLSSWSLVKSVVIVFRVVRFPTFHFKDIKLMRNCEPNSNLNYLYEHYMNVSQRVLLGHSSAQLIFPDLFSNSLLHNICFPRDWKQIRSQTLLMDVCKCTNKPLGLSSTLMWFLYFLFSGCVYLYKRMRQCLSSVKNYNTKCFFMHQKIPFHRKWRG